jgi:hypothetical protein
MPSVTHPGIGVRRIRGLDRSLYVSYALTKETNTMTVNYMRRRTVIHKWEVVFGAGGRDTALEIYSETLEVIGYHNIVVDEYVYIHLPRGCGVLRVRKDGEVV